MKAQLLMFLAAAAGVMAQTVAPSPSLVKDPRCFELRIYHAPPGKLEDLHARFRNHTMKLFAKHGMKVVGFWGPTDKEAGSDNKLIYILEFKDRAARDKAWKEFQGDPDWQAARKASEVNGKLTEKVESIIMSATDYAKVK